MLHGQWEQAEGGSVEKGRAVWGRGEGSGTATMMHGGQAARLCGADELGGRLQGCVELRGAVWRRGGQCEAEGRGLLQPPCCKDIGGAGCVELRGAEWRRGGRCGAEGRAQKSLHWFP